MKALNVDTHARLADALANPGKYGVKFCALCENPFTEVRLFIPNEEFSKQLVNAPPLDSNRNRVIVYGLCDSCAALPDVIERVERSMLKSFRQ